jgi:hypothetical protein
MLWKSFLAAIVVIATVAAAQAMRWDGFRRSTNIDDLRNVELADRLEMETAGNAAIAFKRLKEEAAEAARTRTVDNWTLRDYHYEGGFNYR